MSIRIRFTQLDGKLPNIALMKLAHWHRSHGHDVVFTRRAERDLFEPDYDVVYGSAIFTRTAPTVDRFRAAWPNAFVGGTWDPEDLTTVEQLLGVGEYEHFDYSLYPAFDASIGYTQRGCRMKCPFCGVPRKEGKVKSVNTIADLWRGPGHPKKLHLIDNDFFGQSSWPDLVAAMRDGGFKVCMNQGFNIRLIGEAEARALASLEYRDDQFRERRLYTAWDQLGHEPLFFRGVDHLETAGVPPSHLRAYMLVGFYEDDTWERVWYRFSRMVSRGIEPYPMVHEIARTRDPPWYHKLKQFQRWVIRGLYRAVPWEEYDGAYKRDRVRARASAAAAPSLFEPESVV